MQALLEILKSKFCIILTLFTFVLLGVSFVASWREDHRIASILQDKGAATTYRTLRGAYQGPLGSTNSQSTVGNAKVESFTTIDSREGGSDVCVCPISKMVFIHKNGCESRCPKCHRDFISGIYAGSGYLKTASASDAQLKFVIGSGSQQSPISNGNRQNLTSGNAGQQNAQTIAGGQLNSPIPDVPSSGGQPTDTGQQNTAVNTAAAGGGQPSTAAPDIGQQNIPPVSGETTNPATPPAQAAQAQPPASAGGGNIGTK